MWSKLLLRIRLWVLRDSVLQTWVHDLFPNQQSSLLSVLRGTDKDLGECMRSKNITKMLRWSIMNTNDKTDGYMNDKIVPFNKVSKWLRESYNTNPHWVDHVRIAAFILGNNHPNNHTRKYWMMVAFDINKYIREQKKDKVFVLDTTTNDTDKVSDSKNKNIGSNTEEHD